MIILEILAAWLLADFISGIVHWYQDRILEAGSKWKFLMQVEHDNYLHHLRPGHFLRHSLYENISTSIVFAWPLAFAVWAFDFSMIIWLAFVFVGIANIVHRWSHMRGEDLHPLVRWLQWIGLFISRGHHANHHFDITGVLLKKEQTVGKYCAMSCWLNPMLDAIGFFRLLERIFK